MIDESIGKIIGMAMAYGVSSLGLFLAYVNYRKRIVGAERVMTPTAWKVVVAIVVLVAGGVLVVAQLAQPPAPPEAAPVVEEVEPTPTTAAPPVSRADAPRWPLVGIVVPITIFLFATWVTAALYRHFSHSGH
jgi:hypothetical protein